MARIRGVSRVPALEEALDVGPSVTDGVYNANLAALRERGDDDTLCRQVAGHQELAFSAKALWTHVTVSEIVRTSSKLGECKYLGVAPKSSKRWHLRRATHGSDLEIRASGREARP